jgi:hypothetical protein
MVTYHLILYYIIIYLVSNSEGSEEDERSKERADIF